MAKLEKTSDVIFVRLHLIAPRPTVLQIGAVRRVKEETSAILMQFGLDEQWSVDSRDRDCYLRNVQDLLTDVKTPYERRFGEPFKCANHAFQTETIVSSDLFKRSGEAPVGMKVLLGIFMVYVLHARGNSRRRHIRFRR